MTVFQHVAAVGQLQRLIGVLLDEEDSHSLLAQLFDGIEDLLNDNRRQAERRLIQQQQARLAHQRAPDSQHLLLAAGHGARPLNPALMQARKQLIHPFDAGLELVAVGKKTAHRQVLFHRHPRENAAPFRHNRHRFAHDFRRLPVGNIFTVENHAPAGGARVAAQGTQQSRFSRAVGANQGDNLSLIDMQTDVVQRLDFAVMRADVVKR